ncbi:MAG: NUDIX hydrolase N-terminal domain-containing protein [Bacteroidetes bacterium]|nr:NUDIX hydrolase N-terminal domain-containing protein [Bacteroidota bacterium]
MENKWLQWASQLQSIVQAGLTFGAFRLSDSLNSSSGS